MAEQENKGSGVDTNGKSSVALEERKKPVSDFATSRGGNEASKPREIESKSSGGGFFDIYKPTQGSTIRVWTGIAYGALVCWFAYFIYDKLQPMFNGSMRTIVPVSVAAVIIAGFGLLGYWALGLNRRASDFLIATEGEMKKVNWTSRKEIIGSTKVVVFVVVSMSILLFVVDILFMLFFSWIGVLKAEGLWESLWGK
ncbi:MAG: preprotein translocase subunit SecE [Planctomycetes bacterium]|nr:preprotein translocase subunit SecE [Planctomycetota bacterium]